MILDQPELRCPRGHVIPANAVNDHKRGMVQNVVDDKALQVSRIVCEKCARDAGGTSRAPKPAAKGVKLDKLGQETMAGTVPTIEVK